MHGWTRNSPASPIRSRLLSCRIDIDIVRTHRTSLGLPCGLTLSLEILCLFILLPSGERVFCVNTCWRWRTSGQSVPELCFGSLQYGIKTSVCVLALRIRCRLFADNVVTMTLHDMKYNKHFFERSFVSLFLSFSLYEQQCTTYTTLDAVRAGHVEV